MRFSATLICLLFVFVTPCAFAQQAALDIANRDLQRVWTRDVVPQLAQSLTAKAQAMAGTITQGSGVSVEIYSVTPDVDVTTAMGVTQLNDHGLRMRLPLSGGWRIGLEVDLRVRGRWGPIRWSKRLRVRGVIEDLSTLLVFDLDSSNPNLPTISQMHRPQVSFRVVASTNKWYLNIFLRLFRGKLNQLAHDAVQDALVRADPMLQQMVGRPNLFGVGGAGITAQAGPALPLELAARKIHDNQVSDHLHYGSVASTVYDRPYQGTWEDSLTDPAFNPGNAVKPGTLGDSALWSGHYLAACAYRYAVTGEASLLRDAEAMIDSFHLMLRLRGIDGWLARAVLPASVAPAGYTAHPGHYVTTYQGVDYLNWDFISRDAYMGVLFGLSAVLDLMPSLRAKAGVELDTAMDYILGNGWSARRRDGSVSVTWTMNFPQQLAWLTAAQRAAPQKYAGVLADHWPLADTAWIAQWATTTDPINKYYKFNMAHGLLMTYLRQEADPTRWNKVVRGLRILRSTIGHHMNPHFDVCYASAHPAVAPGMRNDFETLLASWLKRPRRQVTMTNSANPAIQQVFYQPAAVAAVGAPSTGAGEILAKYPIPVTQRRGTDFLWQRNPFRMDGHGNGTENEPGIDFTLPYWLGRYYGVTQ